MKEMKKNTLPPPKQVPISGIEGAAGASSMLLAGYFSDTSPSSTYLNTSFRTKYPLSCGARKKDCANFLRKLSFPVKHPVTKTVTPSL